MNTEVVDRYRPYISEKQGLLYATFRITNPLNFSHPDNKRHHVRVAVTNHSNMFSVKNDIQDPLQQIWLNLEGIQVGDYLVRPNVTFLITDIDFKDLVSVVVTNETVRLTDRSMVILCNQLPMYISREKILNTKEIILGHDCFTYMAIMPNIKTAEPLPNDMIITKDGIRYTIFRAELNGSIWTLFLQRQLKF